MTFLRSLNIVPKYEGNRNVIQHGANKAKAPAKKEPVKEIPKKKLLSIKFLISKSADTYF